MASTDRCSTGNCLLILARPMSQREAHGSPGFRVFGSAEAIIDDAGTNKDSGGSSPATCQQYVQIDAGVNRRRNELGDGRFRVASGVRRFGSPTTVVPARLDQPPILPRQDCRSRLSKGFLSETAEKRGACRLVVHEACSPPPGSGPRLPTCPPRRRPFARNTCLALRTPRTTAHWSLVS